MKMPGNKIIKKDREQEFMLPVSLTPVYQSNRLTNGNFQGFGLMHTKVFLSILKSLQEAIRAEMNGLDWQQMDLFEEVSKESIAVKIYLREISKPNHYPAVLQAAKDMMGLIIKLRKPNPKEGYISFSTLFTQVDLPIKLDGKTVLIVHVSKKVANEIVFIDKNHNGKGINFTKYFYETAISSSSKYTTKLYILISSWKIKGGFYITIDELKFILDIGKDNYRNFSDFKKNVLLPAQKELKSKGDCWFNVAEKDFENKIGKRVVGLNFKVITKKTEEADSLKYDNLRNMLKVHVGFKDQDLEVLRPVLQQSSLFAEISFKVLTLKDKREDENGERIINRVAFITRCLLNEFWPDG